MRFFKVAALHKYIAQEFLSTLFLCLVGSTSLFLVFDFFDRMRDFVKEGVSIIQVLTYLALKCPMIIQLMTPVAVLVATLISIGRLSQLSEITAMRACGASLLWIARPIISMGLLIVGIHFAAGETIVPWATERLDEMYQLDIKKNAELGAFSKDDFWYRARDRFVNVGLYDSRTSKLHDMSLFQMSPDFRVVRRIRASEAKWNPNPRIGWRMTDVVEMRLRPDGQISSTAFPELPLVISENPKDFYNMKRKPEAMNYRSLDRYISKLRREGVPVTKYSVALDSKLSFPFVNLIVVLVGFPFALSSARSGTMTKSFLAGVLIGFGYYIVHALSTSLGSAELLPIWVAAWTANILLGLLGAHLLSRMEFRS